MTRQEESIKSIGIKSKSFIWISLVTVLVILPFILMLVVEGRIFAVFSVIFLWFLSSLLGFIVVSYILSKGFIPMNIREALNSKIIFWIFFVAVVGLPLLAGIAFIIGDIMEGSYPIIWGCYLEWFPVGAGIIWVFLVVVAGVMLIVGQIDPKQQSSNRIKLVLAFFTFTIYSLLMIFVFTQAIMFCAASLEGINRTCF
jgi:hypothetical protein